MSIVIKSSGNLPNSYWNRDNRQAKLDRNNPDKRNDNCGARSAVPAGVKVYVLLYLI